MLKYICKALQAPFEKILIRIALCFLVTTIVLTSCEDVILRDISGEEVTLLAPQDSLSSVDRSFNFWWDPVEGAAGYELLIVTPSRSEVVLLTLDTVVTKDKFLFTLPSEGKYEWCVRAVNSGYKTEYSCRLLEITN